jgi:hypothetical protein
MMEKRAVRCSPETAALQTETETSPKEAAAIVESEDPFIDFIEAQRSFDFGAQNCHVTISVTISVPWS